jgi:hypothetical protein
MSICGNVAAFAVTDTPLTKAAKRVIDDAAPEAGQSGGNVINLIGVPAASESKDLVSRRMDMVTDEMFREHQEDLDCAFRHLSIGNGLHATVGLRAGCRKYVRIGRTAGWRYIGNPVPRLRDIKTPGSKT